MSLPHEPTEKTRKQVEIMIGLTLTHPQIAAILEISDETLRKYYGPELAIGKAKMVAAVGNRVVKLALDERPELAGPSLNASKFYLINQAGWTEKIEHSGKDGALIAPVINVTVGGTEPSSSS